jgi:hypothetical protein
MIRLKGEDVAEGLRDWVKAELKEGPKQAYDLGKFFFSVSVGTIGALVGIDKLNQTTRIDNLLFWALGLLFVSILIALLLALPKKYSIGGETDLLKEYQEQINATVKYVWIWFAFWLVGTIVGGFAIRS